MYFSSTEALAPVVEVRLSNFSSTTIGISGGSGEREAAIAGGVGELLGVPGGLFGRLGGALCGGAGGGEARDGGGAEGAGDSVPLGHGFTEGGAAALELRHQVCRRAAGARLL